MSVAAAPMMTSSSSWVGASNPTTAGGFLALLREDEMDLKRYALQQLLQCVDTLWHEVAEALPELEALAEDDLVVVVGTGSTADWQPLRAMAAAVASRVNFYLEEPQQALRLAILAGPAYFDPRTILAPRPEGRPPPHAPYVERLIAAALDAYVAARRQQQQSEGPPDAAASKPKTKVDSTAASTALSVEQLQGMIVQWLEACCAAGQYRYALGLALEARQTDQIRDILQASGPDPALLQYTLQAVVEHHVVDDEAGGYTNSKAFRQQCLQILAQAWWQQFQLELKSSTPEAAATMASQELLRVYQYLGEAGPVAQVLATLLQGTEAQGLLALQLSFDLMDTGDQAFIQAVAQALLKSRPAAAATEATSEDAAAAAPGVWNQVERVLTGGFLSELSLSFLHKQSRADRLIMDHIKKTLEERSSGSRSSLLHTAAVVTHSYLVAGTTNDSFLRDNLDWMKKASNWAKFSATASLGVVHAAHVTEAMHLLQPYLPPSPTEGGNVSATGGFAEGGSLYALGLIHGSQAGSSATMRQETTEYLRNHLRASRNNEVISHGAALGVGLTAMGSADLSIIGELKEVLYTDSAVAGEAAGIAIGLVLVGTGAGNTHNSLSGPQKEEIMEVVSELKNYARETQHEKIIRGIALGLALMNFGQEEHADATIEEMRSDRDPVMRYGAQYALALAYCGTGSNKAIRILLHTAVSDVSDDVRMAAVIGLAFVMFKSPERVPELVKLLLESFNPHVRCASCIAVGIAMAGTGDSDSVALLEPMMDDLTDYVRQGALIGTAMIYMQQSDTSNGRKIRSFRERVATIITEKHQSTMTKMGAILSAGILDAGGRNCSLVLGSQQGFTKMSSAVGLALWLQYWHWFPMMHMLSMALTPTYTIGLNKDLKYPKHFEIQCNAKPSMFAYPKKLEEKKEEKKKRVETVTLSTTAQEKARLARKRAKMGLVDPVAAKEASSTAMEVDKEEPTADAAAAAAAGGAAENKVLTTGTDEAGATKEEEDAMDVEKDEAAQAAEKKKKKKEAEPLFFRISNPARITKMQAIYCQFDVDQRYRPIRPQMKPWGVIILTDSTPEDEEVDVSPVRSPSLEPEGELPPPEPFEWTPPVARPATEEAPTETMMDAEETPAPDDKAESHPDGSGDPDQAS